MGRNSAFLAVALIALLCVAATAQTNNKTSNVETKGAVFNGRRAVGAAADDSSKGGIAEVVELVAGRVNEAVSGLVGAVGVGKTEALAALLSPLKGTASSMLNSLSAVRDAAEVSLNSFFGLLLDNTKELRSTLEDGNAVIDIVRTLRGAECDEAEFEPPVYKPATIAGPSGSLEITTGSCSLTRSADPLQLTYSLGCTAPGIAFQAKAPRYTSRFVTAASATSEECKATRKYGVESEVVVTLFNPADFFAAATKDDDDKDVEVEVKVEAADGASANTTTGLLGLRRGQAAAGWFNTLFPHLAGGKLGGKEGGRRVQFMPTNVKQAVEKALKQATVDLTLDYKPFTIKQDLIKGAQNVAEALSDTFEVQQRVFKVYKDDLAAWADPERRAEITQDLDFGANLREAMAKYNITSLFDTTFTKTAASLMARTRVGSKVASKLEGLSTERPLRTLLSKAREGAGQPVSIKLEAGLTDAVTQALGALQGTGAGAAAAAALPSLGQLLQAPKKGSLMELLLKGKGTRGHMQELQKVFDTIGDVTAQLGSLRQAAAGVAAGAGANLKAAAAAAADKAADKATTSSP